MINLDCISIINQYVHLKFANMLFKIIYVLNYLRN